MRHKNNGWGKGGKVTTAGWQVTLCDHIWHVISRSGVVISIANYYIRVYFTLQCRYVLAMVRLWKNKTDPGDGSPQRDLMVDPLVRGEVPLKLKNDNDIWLTFTIFSCNFNRQP